jgi:methionyl-tRNA formyltransferase
MNTPLRLAFIGCVSSSRAALQALVNLPTDLAQVTGLVTRRASAFNADFENLLPIAQQHGIATLLVEDAPSDEQQAAWLRDTQPDLVFCVGWSRLLGERVLSVPPLGVVGFHPAALPANRGRHPLIWALALGLQETASSFFLMQADADSGPLLSQQPITIAPDDNATTLYAKVMGVFPQQINDIVRGLADGSLQSQPQDHTRANHWRKRGAIDGQIDWRMSADSIHNLVRALTRPYPGAHFLHAGLPVKLWQCEPVDAGTPNIEPGKVLAVDGQRITIKCGTAAVCLVEHELSALPRPGDYL